MLRGALWAAIAQASLYVGAILVWKFPKLTKPRTMGLIMAFGAGAIISALSTDLVAAAYDLAGAPSTALGLAIGAGGYFAIIQVLERKGDAESPDMPLEREVDEQSDDVEAASAGEARNLLVGMMIEGVPESISIGLTLHTVGRAVSAALVGAVFIGSVPEAIGVTAAMLAGGASLAKVLWRFTLIVVIGAVAGGLGYGALVNADPRLIALIQAIAAGALLVVVVNEMVPMAVRGAQKWAGPLAAGGFVFAALMTWVSGG